MARGGRQNAWQGVALLPFVDEKRLLTAITPMYEKLTDEERRLNESGYDRLFVSNGCKLFEPLCDVYGSVRDLRVVLRMMCPGLTRPSASAWGAYFRRRARL